ncbi:hypothetical protein [uncultured Pelagimonas sp.]|uniref:hypothetical protein n=1 Tax=uncultured Pelagimonas sp. TaxID=1618102 RepID=UPI002616014C|nr:hypothetical protein [uncultured Pelagimonas sp.]
MSLHYSVHEPFLDTVKRAASSVGNWKFLVAIFSTVSVNMAGYVYPLPDHIRQTVDATFFANHVASLTIALAFSVLTWRISYVCMAEPTKIAVNYFLNGSSTAENDDRNSSIHRTEKTSLLISIYLGFSAFIYTHLGITHDLTAFFVILLFLQVLLTLLAIGTPIGIKQLNKLGFRRRRPTRSNTRLLISTRIFFKRLKRIIITSIYAKTPQNIVIAFVLVLSFLSGSLRHYYLANYPPVQVVWSERSANNDELLFLTLIGTTNAGFIFSKPSKIEKTQYYFAPFGNVTAIAETFSELNFSSKPDEVSIWNWPILDILSK